MDQLRQQLQDVATKLNLTNLNQIPLGKLIFKKTSVNLSEIIIVAVPLLIIMTLIFNFDSFVTSIVCCLIPALLSFQALESTQEKDDEKYLTYWVIYALVEVCSPILLIFIGSKLLLLARIASTVLLLHPKFNYSIQVYQNYISPFLKKYENKIDTNMYNIYQEGKKVVLNEISEGIKKID